MLDQDRRELGGGFDDRVDRMLARVVGGRDDDHRQREEDRRGRRRGRALGRRDDRAPQMSVDRGGRARREQPRERGAVTVVDHRVDGPRDLALPGVRDRAGRRLERLRRERMQHPRPRVGGVGRRERARIGEHRREFRACRP
jgi:hypothetical protein